MGYYKIKDGNTTITRAGTQVGAHLAVVRLHGWRIYNLLSGNQFTNIVWKEESVAMQAAEIFSNAYGEYLELARTPGWEDVDIPRLVQWTIDAGVALYNAIEIIEKDGAMVSDNYRIIQACKD